MVVYEQFGLRELLVWLDENGGALAGPASTIMGSTKLLLALAPSLKLAWSYDDNPNTAIDRASEQTICSGSRGSMLRGTGGTRSSRATCTRGRTARCASSAA
jgi:hypothetical protein